LLSWQAESELQETRHQLIESPSRNRSNRVWGVSWLCILLVKL